MNILLQLKLLLISIILKTCVKIKYKTQEICEKTVSKDPFTLKWCPCRCVTQEKCKKAVNAYILTLKFVPS